MMSASAAPIPTACPVDHNPTPTAKGSKHPKPVGVPSRPIQERHAALYPWAPTHVAKRIAPPTTMVSRTVIGYARLRRWITRASSGTGRVTTEPAPMTASRPI